nr:MAG TPA: hypothetical protein [Caudoviricetes sp.]
MYNFAAGVNFCLALLQESIRMNGNFLNFSISSSKKTTSSINLVIIVFLSLSKHLNIFSSSSFLLK